MFFPFVSPASVKLNRRFRRFSGLLLASLTVAATLDVSAQAVRRPWLDDRAAGMADVWGFRHWWTFDLASFISSGSVATPEGVIFSAGSNQTWLGDSGSGGTGTWSTPGDWSPATWVAGNVAVFGGTAGTVTVGTQTASGLTFNVGGYVLQSGTLTLATGSVITTSGGTTSFTSALLVAGGAGVKLTKTGAGILSLAPTSGNTGLGTAASPASWTVTGSTTASATAGNFDSVLSITLGNNFGATPTAATTQLILDSGTLEVRGSGANNTNTIGATRIIQVNPAGGAIRDVSGFNNTYNSPVTFSNPVAGTTLYLSNTSGMATFAGVISGAGSIVWNGAGALSFGATNTYSGGTVLNGGVLELTSNKAGGTGGIAVNSGAELSTLGSQITNALTVNGGKLSWDFYSGSGDYQGPVTLQAGGGTVSLVSFYSGGTSISGTISGNVSGAGALSTSNVGPNSTSSGGVLTLSGTNSYTGGTTIGVGTTILAGSSTALGATTGALSVAGTLNLNGNSFNVGALALSDGANFNFTLGTNNVMDRLTASSITSAGTTYLGFNLANLSGTGTYPVITSTDGNLGNAFGFAGAYNLTVPVSSIITQTSGGSYYRLALANTGTGTEQLVASSDVPSKMLTILPLGSSITAGQSAQSPYNGGGYRQQLYQDLVNDGRFNPNYIGSSTATLANNPTGTTILTTANQGRHEGHPGWTTLQILANLGMSNGDPGANGGNYLGTDNPGYGTPNYVTINIGGNDAVDYGQTQAVGTAASQRLDAIVSKINTLRPGNGVDTIVSTIVYRGDNSNLYGPAIDAYYNPTIAGVVFNHVLAGQSAGYLDLRNIINYTTDISSDHVHPFQAGYDKMADAWYQSVAYGAAYWTGSQGSVWNTVNGTSTNFAMDAARTTDRSKGLNNAATNTFLIYPDVYFNNNTAALNTTLGADTTVRSLNFTSGATGPVMVGAGNTLTIGSVDTSADANTPDTLMNSGGITVQAGTGAHTIAANIALGADQTWGNVSSNNLTVTGNVSGAYNLALIGSYTVYNPGTYTPNGTNYQGASYTTTPMTVSGTGGFVLSGSNTYTGTTTITGVTLTLNNAGSTTPRLAGTSGIVLNTGGTLLLASSGGASTNRIGNNVPITLAGGTLNTGGLSEGTVSGTTPTQGIGALTLSANSILDLGNGASNVTFASSSASVWAANAVLSIYDWTGSTAGGGTDKVFFGNNGAGLTSAQLSQVAFYSDAGTTLLGYGGILPDGEIVPVPEPATILGALLLVGTVGWRGGRRWRARVCD